MKYWTCSFFIFIFFNIGYLSAQNKAQQKRMFYDALDYIYKEKYNQALSLLYQLDNIKLERFLSQRDANEHLDVDTTSIEKVYVKYLIGTCFLEQKDNSGKALKYIEYVVSSGYSKTPDIIYKDLGDLYHHDYQFDKSIHYYNRFLSKAKLDDEFRPYVKRMLDVCKNAQNIVKDTIPVNIKKLPYPVCTEMDEMKPLGTVDDSKLFLSRSKITQGKSGTDTSYTILMFSKTIGVWKKPQIIYLKGQNEPVDLAGISPSGDKIYFAIGFEKQKALYEAKLRDTVCVELTRLPFSNPKFNDTEIAFSMNGEVAYFVSTRPGGYGGSDIYSVEHPKEKSWSEPVNVGNTVNTEYDEASPCMKAEGTGLYFSSKGHNTIGGFDLFELDFKDSHVRNMGFPINTPNDNKYISIADSGRIAYFSNNPSNKEVSRDIYRMDIKKVIPYTMIRGTLKVTNAAGNIKAKIKVINKKDASVLLLKTDPDTQNGNYFIFFPPGKEYTLIVEAEGYQPQMINIKVPLQDFFYELRQELIFSHLMIKDKIVGEQIQVRNNFSVRGTKFSYADIFNEKKRKDYDSLVSLVNAYASKELNKQAEPETSKSGGEKKNYGKLFNLINESIEKNDTSALAQLSRNTPENEFYSSTFFYSKSKENTLLTANKIGANEYIYTAPQIDAYDKSNIGALNKDANKLVESSRTITSKDINIPVVDLKRIDSSNILKEVNLTQIFFENGKFDILPKFTEQIRNVADLMIDNLSLFVEISGYSNAVGDSVPNLKLSEDRAIAIKQALISNNIKQSRIRIFYYGDSKSKNETSENDIIYNRRVDVKLYNLENKIR